MYLPRWFALGILILLTGCGSPQRPSVTSSASVPNDVTIVCARDGSYALRSSVQALSDGAHITIDNRGAFKEYVIRRPGAEGSHGGTLGAGSNDEVDPLAPGEIWIQCYDAPKDAFYGEQRSAGEVAIEVVDTEGLYQHYDLQCDGAKPEFGGRFEGFDASDDVDRWIRATIPGVRSSDAILHPGYPDVQWKGDFRVIERDARRVALVQLWGIDVQRCPGIDIGT